MPNITKQPTIYRDRNGHLKETSNRDLSYLNITEIIQIGFYPNQAGQIQAVRIPRTVERVPNQLPPQITSMCLSAYDQFKL